MQRLIMQRVNQPHRVTVFLFDYVALFEKTLIYLFGLNFVLRIMQSPLSLIYPTVSNGDKWIVTLYILF
jgi:hypothetical protein